MTADGLDLSRATWRKSTYSNNGGSCVEVGDGVPGVVAVRDSKNPGGPALAFTLGQWMAFTSTVTAAVVRDRGIAGAGQAQDRVEVRLSRS
jgi:hypothetical protein